MRRAEDGAREEGGASGAAADSAVFHYFGYGSLVNRGTLPPEAVPVRATLRGFRRAWRAASLAAGRGVCALSVEPAEGAQIRGFLVREPADGLARLDAREHRYHRHRLPGARLVLGNGAVAPDFYLYRAQAPINRWGDAENPIWLSYLDCVLQGFYREWGEEGLAHFTASTDGWHVPVVDDRDSPAYVRARTLAPEERRAIDAALAAAGVRPRRQTVQRR